jgi:hypothetical protein
MDIKIEDDVAVPRDLLRLCLDLMTEARKHLADDAFSDDMTLAIAQLRAHLRGETEE